MKRNLNTHIHKQIGQYRLIAMRDKYAQGQEHDLMKEQIYIY